MLLCAFGVLIVGVISDNSDADHYGPAGCVSVALSKSGTCVLSTSCHDRDTSALEFAFDCQLPDGSAVERHSFGRGGFDANEDFDSGVKCLACSGPGHTTSRVGPMTQQALESRAAHQNVVLTTNDPGAYDVVQGYSQAINVPDMDNVALRRHAKSANSINLPALKPTSTSTTSSNPTSETSTTSKGMSTSKTESPTNKPDNRSWMTPPQNKGGRSSQVQFGPDDCVSTWRSQAGHCIMQTQCKSSNIDEYEFGLVCVDSNGRPVRHVFGKGSFDPEETFDTLILCTQCLGLQDVPDDVMLKNEVLGVSAELKDMQKLLQTIVGNITQLNEKVFSNTPRVLAPSPQPVVAASPVAAPPQVLLNRQLRGSRKHHSHRREQISVDNQPGDALLEQRQQRTQHQNDVDQQKDDEIDADQMLGAESADANVNNAEQQEDEDQVAGQFQQQAHTQEISTTDDGFDE